MTETAQHTPKRARRRAVAAAALAAALPLAGACDLDGGLPGTPRPAAQATSDAGGEGQARGFDEAEFQEDLRSAATVTNGFWRRHWQGLFTGTYRPPRVRGLYDGRDPGSAPRCGGKPLEPGNAAYCPGGDYVAWDARLMRSGYARGDAWVYLVVAHEWGHAIQNRLRRNLVSAASELQADCLAGAALYGASKDGRLTFEKGDQQEIVAAFKVIGDKSPWTRPGDHGTSSQRLRSFSRGGNGGAKACFS
ncbi:neutral zinc metallopeptidase [Actinomadura graeca]|uniref:Neutral zinc metallopeptidase n=1 Tax=Actinomadura graeca TaxID=2750812 RepID=A0ABX8R3Y5_9ACTN|nr:neutral zinc metallopeptidase [Actinomadura graeca]QXJ25174.1 neutral zinc metallopeptidase [Actinomadura graeca]